MNIASPLPSVVPAFPLANRAGGPATSAAEPNSGVRESGEGSEAGVNRSARSRESGSSAESSAQGLDSAQLKQLADLKSRDREVRAHEAAHQAVGGQYAGAISYVYERGPDGAQYAVGGEVSIDTSPVDGDPQATIEKMRTVRAAALAPAEPSPQDRAVAAQAMQLMLQAQSQLASGLAEGARSQDDPAEPRVSSRASQGASDTYQSVSGLGESAAIPGPGEAFQATA
jgi:hypothetical protein